MTLAELTDSIRALLLSGLTVRDVAELLRAHERAIEVLLRRQLESENRIVQRDDPFVI